MFETEFVLWLQSFSSEWLTAIMVFASETGVTSTYVMLAIIVTFGLSFRAGFTLFQFLVWTGAVTNVLKVMLALPRPAEIDAAVELLAHDTANPAPFDSADGDHFFDLPKSEAIDYYRADANANFGFPSGHVSTATAFWMGSAVVLRSRQLAAFGFAYVALVAVSRMYLGRHFLADVLGGFALAMAIVVALRFLLHTAAAEQLFQRRRVPAEWSQSKQAGLLALFLLPPLALIGLASDPDVFDAAGRLLAVNLAFAILFLRGLPTERTTPVRRIARVGLALGLFAVSLESTKALTAIVGVNGTAGGEFAVGCVPPLVYLLGTVWLGERLGLYSRHGTRPAKVMQSA